MNRTQKKRIIAQLVNTRGKLQRLYLELALDGEDTSELDRKLNKLDREINGVRRALHENWQGRAVDVERELKRSNDRIQRRIRDINNDIKRAERLVSLLGDVEQVIATVRGILP